MFKALCHRAMLYAAFAVFFVTPPAIAQKLSDRTITIVVPFTAASGPDILARIVSDEIKARWNQAVIVDNKPGASGNIGAAHAARATPDGHTLVLSVNTFLMNAALYKALPYDPVKDFEPIIELAKGSLALAVHPSVSANTTREFIDLAKANPNKIAYSSPGRGTPHHMAMELFKLQTGAPLHHVPYSGTAGAVNDLLAGHVQAMFIPIHLALEQARAGKLKLLALGSNKRSTTAPDLQTLEEQGISGVEVDLWYALSAPANTPKDIVTRFNAILADGKIKVQFEKQGLATVGGTSQSLADLIGRDAPRWQRVVKEANISLDQ
jgi:tripartite-type tricarboxylate transporter receptor subunit TctC